MNLYEHTIVARQDVSPSQLKELMEKYNALMQQLDQKYRLGIYTDEHQVLANLAKKSGIFY